MGTETGECVAVTDKESPDFHVSIAAHYVPARVPFLIDVLEAIVEWDRPKVTVTLVTNDLALGDEPSIKQVGEALKARGYEMKLDRAHGMAHPWHLTWWHKTAMRNFFSKPNQNPRDLFMYIEDDIVVDRENVAYFEHYLPLAKEIGCLPGFLRFEKGRDAERISPDFRGYQHVTPDQCVELDGQLFVAPEFSYWAGFILDRELCDEYLGSPWSDLEAADTMPQSHKHSCRVQSAWALTFENVPKGFPSRYIVPVDEELRPLPCCEVWHSANNYSVSNTYNFGTVKMADAFQSSKLAASLRQGVWNAGAFRRRVIDKFQRESKRLTGRS